MSSFTHFPYLLPVATKWELQQSMHCPLSQCCHSFLFSPSERTKWRSKKDPQILELEGLRGLRVLGNKIRSDFYPKIRYFCKENFFVSQRMAEIRQLSFWWKTRNLIGRLCSKYLDTSFSRQYSKKNPKMSWFRVWSDWLHILTLIFGHSDFFCLGGFELSVVVVNSILHI